MSKLSSLRRRKRRRNAIARALRAWALVRIAFRAFKTYRRARGGALRFAKRVAIAAVTGLVIRRLARRRQEQPAEPYIAPAPPPSSNGLHSTTATERNLEAEKDSS